MKKYGSREGQTKDLSIAGPELVQNAKGRDRFSVPSLYLFKSLKQHK